MKRLTLALLLASRVAHADTAQEHFDKGLALYESTRYEAALREFETAQALQFAPALLYDMGKCLERLGRKDEAARAYERYLREAPDAPEREEVRALIASLRAVPAVDLRADITTELPAPKSKRYLIAASVTGGAALLLAGIGGGLVGSARADYAALEGSCAPTCTTSSWAGLPARERAGYALIGIGGAVAAVDVFLLYKAVKEHR